MTLAAFLAGLASLGTIVGAIYGVFKFVTWKVVATPEQKKETIDEAEAKAEAQEEKTGRPS